MKFKRQSEKCAVKFCSEKYKEKDKKLFVAFMDLEK